MICETSIMCSSDGFLRQRQRHRIIREGPRRTAKEIPRKLIQNDDLGQTTSWRSPPLGQLANDGSCVYCAKAPGNLCVERGVCCPPHAWRILDEPEVEDFFVHGTNPTLLRPNV